MEYAYNYEILKVDEEHKSMEIIYTSLNREPVHVSARLPYQGEDLLSLIHMYSPVPRWKEEELSYIIPVEGTSGSYTPAILRTNTLLKAKEAKKASIALWRFQKEIGGIEINGSTFSTERSSQSQLLSTYISLKENLLSKISWKTIDGSFISLNLEDFREVLIKVLNHTQECFQKEEELCKLVDSCNEIGEIELITLPNIGERVTGLGVL